MLNKEYISARIKEHLEKVKIRLNRDLVPEDVMHELPAIYKSLKEDGSDCLGSIPYQTFEMAAVTAYSRFMWGV